MCGIKKSPYSFDKEFYNINKAYRHLNYIWYQQLVYDFGISSQQAVWTIQSKPKFQSNIWLKEHCAYL